jgi:hypothetical protein
MVCEELPVKEKGLSFPTYINFKKTIHFVDITNYFVD